MISELTVTLENEIIGFLDLTKNRLLEFRYDENWLKRKDAIPISVRLPLENRIFQDESARPFFENLLPEGYQRKMVAQEFQVSEQNIFGLLEAIGGECAGAISIQPPKRFVSENKDNYKLLHESEIEALISELPNKPLLASKNLRLSLAGVQEKILVYIENEKIYLPAQNHPSTHILKPGIKHFEHSAVNEFFCMSLARKMGLSIPDVKLLRMSQPLYVIQRFDRIVEQPKQVKRLHQEDFCQASGCYSDQKYESEGGPSLKKCVELIRNYSIQPAKDIHQLIRWIAYNYLIGNADAHGKNIAFLLTKEGPFLAPFYDLLSTEVYPSISKRFSMKVGGENRGEWIQKRHWERFANAIEIKFSFIQKIMEEITKLWEAEMDNIPNLMKQFDKEEQMFCYKILEIFKNRIQKLIC